MAARALANYLARVRAQVRDHETAFQRLQQKKALSWHIRDLAEIERDRQIVRDFLATNARLTDTLQYGESFIRAELNTWAAYLETCDYNPNFAVLMEHMIRTKQLFTIRRPLDAANEARVDDICLGLAQLFAQTTEGIYQVDQQGFFDPNGLLLLQEY